MNRLPASTGWLWLKEGFALFRKQPGLLIMLLFPQMMFTVLMLGIQPVGSVIYTLLLPSFSIVIFEASRLLAQNQPLNPMVILAGFRKGALGPLAKLGGVYLGLMVLLMLAMLPFLDREALLSAYDTAQKTKKALVMPESLQQTIIGFALLAAALMFVLSFAAPLIHWKKMPTFKAMFYSVAAMFGSFAPVLVMVLSWGAIWITIMTIGTVVFGKSALIAVMTLVHLVLLVIFQCAVYAAYRQLIPNGSPD